MRQNSDRTRLARAFEEFKRIPFPPSPGDEKELIHEFAFLIQDDAGVAGVVTTILEHTTPKSESESFLRSLQGDSGFEDRVRKLMEKYPNTQTIGRVARLYMSHYGEIRKLAGLASSYLCSRENEHQDLART